MAQTYSLQALPLLPLRHGVLFPGTTVALPIGRRQSLALMDAVQPGDRLAVAVQRDPSVEDPGLADLLPIATLTRIVSVHHIPGSGGRLVLEADGRATLLRLVSSQPFWRADLQEAAETGTDTPEALALASTLRDRLTEIGAQITDELARRFDATRTRREPGRLADLVAAGLGLPPEKEIPLLLELDAAVRLRTVLELLAEAKAMAELKNEIDSQVSREIDKSQREVILRQQLQAIRSELGDGDDDATAALRQRFAERELPEEVRRVVDRELDRLAEIQPGQAEHNVITKYLELIADLPWDHRSAVSENLDAIAAHLDADHYGLDEVKKRILEHLAVAKMTGHRGGAILCLVGPPGVGKTSLGQSIADSTGRPFVRVSLGGVRDEAEIRGHRRTYVGALPGRILAALRRAEVKNPVVLLDEIDKLGQGFMGSPESALLEVLDPEQNSTFTDHYLELPFDLSETVFVCTANALDTISGPLRDRLEIIELDGYTIEEKLAIARRHLLPKQLEQNGLTDSTLRIPDASLLTIIADYTREAGVRQLTRELGKICRAVTLEIARRPDEVRDAVVVDDVALRRYLGKQRFFRDAAERTASPGVATGLAWTPVGGDILFIETSRMPGRGRLETTGQLGDVMKESARAALTYVRSHADALGVDPSFLDRQDLHVHVPAGAVPKDGPSAGVTIFTALTSLLTERKVRSDTAMTGECTLRGRVLPVGGIKSKVLAAHRAGIRRVILPAQNQRDLDDIPADVLGELEILFADDMSQVLDGALEAEVTRDAPLGSLAPSPSVHLESSLPS